MSFRIGQGIDFHRLVVDRRLYLGGILIPHTKGCLAHSDGDALLHAICDAMLGAAGLDDIGHQFPDSDPQYRDIDSKILLERTMTMINKKGYRVVNIDATICLEKPKIAPYIPEMKRIIASICDISEYDVSVKATTTEKMGFTGREEGLFALASVLIYKD